MVVVTRKKLPKRVILIITIMKIITIITKITIMVALIVIPVFLSLLVLMESPLMVVGMSFPLKPKLESLKLGVLRTRLQAHSLRSARRIRRRVSAATNLRSRKQLAVVIKRSITIRARGLNWQSQLFLN
jgi:hypothetical protein